MLWTEAALKFQWFHFFLNAFRTRGSVKWRFNLKKKKKCISINLNKDGLHEHQGEDAHGQVLPKVCRLFLKTLVLIPKQIFPNFFDMIKIWQLVLNVVTRRSFAKGSRMAKSQSQWQSHRRRHIKSNTVVCCTWDVQAYTGLRANRALLPLLGTLSQWYMTNNHT